jgi:nicotinamide riboside kinase
MRINIAISGGPCTGKSTLAAALFAELKFKDFDYDLITEESRKLRKEFGHFRSPFERFYIWRQQEREELRSTASDGFITDTPLFHYYVQAIIYASEPRDDLAIRELFRMCMEIKDRYQLISFPSDPREIRYKTDQSRCLDERKAREKNDLIRSFLEHFWPKKLIFIKGDMKERTRQVIEKLMKMRATAVSAKTA